MPIYEYLCRDCNTVYQFFSRTSSPKADPSCPKFADHSALERQMSGFAIGGPRSQTSSADPSSTDDPAMTAKMEGLLAKMDGIDESDPRAMGRLMREMSALTGERDPSMDEAIRRLEGGEDPEKVEELLDSQLGDTSTGSGGGFGSAPSFDSSLYDL